MDTGTLSWRSKLIAAATLLTWLLVLPASESPAGASPGDLPVRGLHLSAPSKKELPQMIRFIGGTLRSEGINTLILEFNYNFDFQSRPELANTQALGKAEVRQILNACREAQIELIPQINCLGHQSWAKRNNRLLEKHPEFDETPGKYPGNEGIYCRSYCPLHPEVHQVIFALIDELASACEARSFHVGMDEVFILADPDCPRCHGKDPAELFAGEVKTLHAHLKETGRRMWMWGDRFLDGKSTKLGKWEASENGTESAIDLVPREVVICDWHYDKASETAEIFARKGFDVVACPWRKTEVALAQLSQIRGIRSGSDPEVARHAIGIMQTTWCGFAAFAKACEAPQAAQDSQKNAPAEVAKCFLELCKATREKR